MAGQVHTDCGRCQDRPLVVWCHDCSRYLCLDCKNAHKTDVATRNHLLRPIEGLSIPALGRIERKFIVCYIVWAVVILILTSAAALCLVVMSNSIDNLVHAEIRDVKKSLHSEVQDVKDTLHSEVQYVKNTFDEEELDLKQTVHNDVQSQLETFQTQLHSDLRSQFDYVTQQLQKGEKERLELKHMIQRLLEFPWLQHNCPNTSSDNVDAYSKALLKRWILANKTDVPCKDFSSLRVINRKLWVCCGVAGIVVLDGSLQQQDRLCTVPGQCPAIYDLLMLPKSQLVIATDQGLCMCNVTTGAWWKCFNGHELNILSKEGSFLSVEASGNQIFAVRYDTHSIHVYGFNGKAWTEIGLFPMIGDKSDDSVTLSVTGNYVTQCSALDNVCVRQYPWRGLNVSYGSTQGLQRPYICDDDDEGSVLIADHDSGQLIVLSDEGILRGLVLQPLVSKPTDAELFNNSLYVVSETRVMKYAHDEVIVP